MKIKIKIDEAFAFLVSTFFRRNSNEISYQKRATFLTQIFLFDFLLDYNRGISVVCSNLLNVFGSH
jgi:hypothetical protein